MNQINKKPKHITAKPVPLFPTYQELVDFQWSAYPQLRAQLDGLPSWCATQWAWANAYLLFLGRNKSEHTFIRFRSDIEKFMLWCFLVAKKPIDECRKNDLLDYAEFFFKPPKHWIGLTNADKFVMHQGVWQANPLWRPYRYIADSAVEKNANAADADVNTDVKKYRPSQQSLLAMFSALSSFYTYLMDEELSYGNPAHMAKKDCKRLVNDAQIKENKRLDQQQWQFLLDTAKTMADDNPACERNLFLIAAMKTLFLRISELSERDDWVPQMGHFWQDDDKHWWLKIYGKGRKLRDISVPDSFLPYLERYRTWRGLSALPTRQERQPIVEKIRGSGGMGARQLARLVHQVLERAYQLAEHQLGKKAAHIYKEVSPHWLRHTGASLEIERGRALKDVSEDLGHASMATTDTVYVQSSAKERAKSGKTRQV